MNARVVLCTCPDQATASRIAHVLVDERLAACVNALGGVTSTYRWNGRVQVDEEVLLVIKTTVERLEILRKRLIELHPYEIPEVIAIAPDSISAPYLAWLQEETQPS